MTNRTDIKAWKTNKKHNTLKYTRQSTL